MKLTTLSLIATTGLFMATASDADIVTWTIQSDLAVHPDFPLTDPLGIAGETMTFVFTIDTDTAVWDDTNNDGELFVPMTSATASITGGSTIEFARYDYTNLLSAPAPALRVRSANNAVAPVEQVGTNSFLDVVIDGTPFLVGILTDNMVPAVVPTDGDAFTIDHLGTNFPSRFELYNPSFTPDTQLVYTGVNGSITAVPEPTSLALLGLGGLLVARRRRRA